MCSVRFIVGLPSFVLGQRSILEAKSLCLVIQARVRIVLPTNMYLFVMFRYDCVTIRYDSEILNASADWVYSRLIGAEDRV